MWHWLWLAGIGLVAGTLAKALGPGTKGEPQGCLFTILVGIAGSLVVGFVMHDLLKMNTGGGLIGTIVGATLGAFALMWVAGKVKQ